MNTTDWAVAIGGVIAIALVNWYYFAPRAAATAAVSGDGVQAIRITVKGGYSPQSVRVKRGKPVRLVFDRQENAPCSEEIVIGDFGIRQFLQPFKETAVTFMPDRAGTFDMTCGMSMLHGSIVVED
jgi:plastocyanin domain-containing protein